MLNGSVLVFDHRGGDHSAAASVLDLAAVGQDLLRWSSLGAAVRRGGFWWPCAAWLMQGWLDRGWDVDGLGD